MQHGHMTAMFGNPLPRDLSEPPPLSTKIFYVGRRRRMQQFYFLPSGAGRAPAVEIHYNDDDVDCARCGHRSQIGNGGEVAV